jgi:hypothetical protein
MYKASSIASGNCGTSADPISAGQDMDGRDQRASRRGLLKNSLSNGWVCFVWQCVTEIDLHAHRTTGMMPWCYAE